MALEITKYLLAPRRSGTQPDLLLGTDLGTESVAVGAGSAASAAFPAGTEVVLLVTTEACRIAFGSAPTAGATSRRLQANSEYVFAAGVGDKVAVIAP